LAVEASDQDEFDLPGCWSSVGGAILFGIPGLFLFGSLSVAAGYGADGSEPMLYVLSALLILEVAFIARGVTRQSFFLHGLAFAIITASVVALGWLVS